jgi:RNA polymerase sigma-70 factor (ECF subfamily)
MSARAAQEARADVAFERLYEQHRRDVYRFVLRDLRNPDDAEDVTQTAFLNAYRALKHGDEPEKPRAWLFAIAQNVTRRRFRSSASRPHEVELDPELVSAPEAVGPTAAEINDALGRLRPNYRSVLILREIGGLSYAEVAEHLGLSVAAVETLIFRARRALRTELAPEQRGRITVGGIVIWPLSEALSNLTSPAGAWLARTGLATKVAAVGGAAVIGTGAALQTGAVSMPGTGSSKPALEPVVQVRAVGGDAAKPAPAGPTRAAGQTMTAEKGEGSGRAGAPASATATAEDQRAAGTDAPAAEVPEGVPPLDVPSLGIRPVDDVVTAAESTAGKVVEPVEETVAPVLEPVNKTVAPVLEPASKAAGDVLEPVGDAADPLLPATDLP